MPVIHGVRAGGAVKPLQLDANDQVIVSVKMQSAGNADLAADSSGRLIVVTPQPNYLNPVSQIVTFSNLALPAGASVQTIYTIPASQRMILKHFTYRYFGTVAGVILLPRINRGGTVHILDRNPGIASNEVFKLQMDIILNAADIIEVRIDGATVNDDLIADVFLSRIE